VQILKGKYNKAKVFADELEKSAKEQILRFLDHPAFARGNIAIMPDVHAGKGAVIGFTMPMSDWVIPNVIGVDIGCGVYGVELGERKVDFNSLDDFIRHDVPSGFKVNPEIASRVGDELKEKIKTISSKVGSDPERDAASIGSLGGGNHFIEIDRSEKNGSLWLVVHSGSRHFGYAVAQYHQNRARNYARMHNIEVHGGLEYLPLNEGGKEYIEDMKVAQQMAQKNRRIMAGRIVEDFLGLDMEECETVESIHNYINFDDHIMRKGAVSAHLDEKLIIPFNMRDGAVIARGKGNPDWNYSAPHGAGREMSRTEAKKEIDYEKFKKSMENVWSTSVSKKTLDEAPFAYKNMKTVLSDIEPTIEILFFMKPVYNFKAP
jgi:RNA-splicing ligase RtcB